MKLNVWTRSTLWLSLIVLPPALAAQLQVDHVTIAGPELGPLEAGLQKLGLHVEYGGAHANHVTEMAIASFPDGSYIELIAFQKNADPAAAAGHYWAKYMRANAGPCAWAVRSLDVGVEAARLRAAGVEVSALHHSGRTRPDGFRLEWETAQAGNLGDGIFFPFLIRDFTPREKRAFPTGKPGNPDFTGVTRIRILTRNLDSAIQRFRQAYNLAEPQPAGASGAVFAGTPLYLIAPRTPGQLARLDQLGEGVDGIGLQRAGTHEVLWIPAAP